MGEFNVNKSDGSLEQTAGMPETYPASQVMMSDGTTSVEEAVNTLEGSVGSIGYKLAEIVADGVKTYSQLLNEAFPRRYRLARIDIDSTMFYPSTATRYGHVGATSNDDISFRMIVLRESGSTYKSATVNSSTGVISVTDLSNSVPPADVKIKLIVSFTS